MVQVIPIRSTKDVDVRKASRSRVHLAMPDSLLVKLKDAARRRRLSVSVNETIRVLLRKAVASD